MLEWFSLFFLGNVTVSAALISLHILQVFHKDNRWSTSGYNNAVFLFFQALVATRASVILLFSWLQPDLSILRLTTNYSVGKLLSQRWCKNTCQMCSLHTRSEFVFVLVDCSVKESTNTGQRSHLLWTECVCSPQIHMLKPNPQCDGIRRWGLWEAMRFRWGHEGGALMMGSVAL